MVWTYISTLTRVLIVEICRPKEAAYSYPKIEFRRLMYHVYMHNALCYVVISKLHAMHQFTHTAFISSS